LDNDKILGSSIDKTYNFILQNKSLQKTIVVAVIDGGVDINHEDLKGKIWVNSYEIPNNGIDDDNGYVDDVNGWNFLGNANVENIIYENMDVTRLLKSWAKNPISFILKQKLSMIKNYLMQNNL